jgi:hypothetical protein
LRFAQAAWRCLRFLPFSLRIAFFLHCLAVGFLAFDFFLAFFFGFFFAAAKAAGPASAADAAIG